MVAFCSTISTATPGGVDLLDDLEVLLDERGRQAHRRLVHQQQPRPRHQRPAHRDHLLLAARQRPRELAAALAAAAGTARGRGRSPRRASRRGAAPRRARGSRGRSCWPNSRRFSGTIASPRGDPLRHRRTATRPRRRAAPRPERAAARCPGSSSASSTCPRRCRRAGRPARPPPTLQRDPLQDPHLPVVGGDACRAQQRVGHPSSARASGSRPR